MTRCVSQRDRTEGLSCAHYADFLGLDGNALWPMVGTRDRSGAGPLVGDRRHAQEEARRRARIIAGLILPLSSCTIVVLFDLDVVCARKQARDRVQHGSVPSRRGRDGSGGVIRLAPGFDLVAHYTLPATNPKPSSASFAGCAARARPGAARRHRLGQDLHDGATSSPQLERPTLVIAHNKTLAAQLYGEFKRFFPDNAVEYFVSYYDYYQPEAYVPSTNTYIDEGRVHQRRHRYVCGCATTQLAHDAQDVDHGVERLVHLRPRLARAYATMTIDRSTPGDRSTASDLLRASIEHPVFAQRRRTSRAARSACAATWSRSAPRTKENAHSHRVLRRRRGVDLRSSTR